MLNGCQAEYSTLSFVLELLLLLLEQPTDRKKVPAMRIARDKTFNFLTSIILKINNYRVRYADAGPGV